MSLLKEFQSYAQKESINILQDGSGFSAVPIYASVEELQEIGKQINEIIKNYTKKNSEASGDQKLHIMATILTPPKEIEEGNE
jgi:hypothetical protein